MKHSTSPFTFNVPALIREIKQEASWEKNGRSAKTLQKLNGLRLVLNSMKAGTEIKPHQANGPISIHCIEGQLKFIAEEKAVLLQKGEMLTLQEHVRHSVEAVEETNFLLTIATPADTREASSNIE